MQVAENYKNELSNFSILILEDNLSFALELEILVKSIGYQVKRVIANSAGALENILLTLPDLVMMDIQLKEEELGVKVIEKIKDKEVSTIFITSIANEKVYKKANKTDYNINYLVKPVSKIALQTTFEQAIATLTKTAEHKSNNVYCGKKFLYFKKSGIFHKMKIADIFYIQSNRDRIIIHSKNNKFISFLSLRELAEKLKKQNFVRIHRSYLANIRNATSIDLDNSNIYFSGVKIPFSRRKKKEVLSSVSFL